MFSTIKKCVCVPLIAIAAVSVQADLLDMELGVSSTLEAALLNDLDPNYGGFTWDDSFAIANVEAYNSVFFNSAVLPSGQNYMTNQIGDELLTVNTGGLIDLESAFFSGFTSENALDGFFSATSVTIEGYLNGILQGAVSFDLTAGFEFYSIGLNNIDSFNILNQGGFGVWLLDDLSFSSATPPTAIFEPSTLALIGLGLVVFAITRRKS